ncbi:MAG: PHP domain-containing protein [Candidatus Helarchaeota archaeon]
MIGKWLLCDFHIHTNLSDGKLPLNEVIDLFGKKKFDVICITDHILDAYTTNERKRNGSPLNALEPEKFEDYLERLWEEEERAWKEYKMLVIPGTEITNDYKKYHILAIDIKKYIDPDLPVEKIVKAIHKQGGIAIACHPHNKDSEGPQPFIHLWDMNDKYKDIFDAWEVANRDDLFNVIGLKKFNYIANSDFHEKIHLYSWKTLVKSEKNTEDIKLAIKRNNNIAIYLYRFEMDFED